MPDSVDSVDQALLNLFSFEIAIISASGKNVESSCWVIDKFRHCCEISYGVNLLSHFRPSSLPLSTYQPIFHNFLCSLFAFARSLSKVRALSGSVWSMASAEHRRGDLHRERNAPAPPAVGPGDFGRLEQCLLFISLTSSNYPLFGCPVWAMQDLSMKHAAWIVPGCQN